MDTRGNSSSAEAAAPVDGGRAGFWVRVRRDFMRLKGIWDWEYIGLRLG